MRGKYHGSGVLDKVIDGVGKVTPVSTGLTGLSMNIASKGIDMHQARKLTELQRKKEKIDQDYAAKRREMDDKLEEERRKKELEHEIEKRKKEDYDRKMKEMDLEIKRAMLEKLKPKSKKGKQVKIEEVEDDSEALKENDPKTYKEVEKAIKSIILTGESTRPDGYGGSVREKIGRGLYSQKLKN